jgi:hypothetical protein
MGSPVEIRATTELSAYLKPYIIIIIIIIIIITTTTTTTEVHKPMQI